MPLDADVRAIQSWLMGDEPSDPPLFDAEERKELDWHELETAARDFAKVYGNAAMLRCVSEALR